MAHRRAPEGISYDAVSTFYVALFGSRNVNSYGQIDCHFRAALQERGYLPDGNWSPAMHQQLRKLKRGMIRSFPTEVVKKPAFPPTALAEAFNVTNWNDFTHVQDVTLVVVGLLGLLRRGEVARLTWKDITEDDSGLTLRLHGTKTSQHRPGTEVVHLPRCAEPYLDVYSILPRYKRVVRLAGLDSRPDAPVFMRADTGRPHQLKFISRIVTRTARRGGVDAADREYTAHSLRSAGYNYFLSQGVPLDLVTAHGRWLSDSHLAYRRRDAEVMAARWAGAESSTTSGTSSRIG